LFAAVFERADDPIRLEPALVPIRLVVGWFMRDDGLVPVLTGHSGKDPWSTSSPALPRDAVKQVAKAAGARSAGTTLPDAPG